jgi:hypothetical protein
VAALSIHFWRKKWYPGTKNFFSPNPGKYKFWFYFLKFVRVRGQREKQSWDCFDWVPGTLYKLDTNLSPWSKFRIQRQERENCSAFSYSTSEATTLVPECHVKWDWDGMWDGKRGFWMVTGLEKYSFLVLYSTVVAL